MMKFIIFSDSRFMFFRVIFYRYWVRRVSWETFKNLSTSGSIWRLFLCYSSAYNLYLIMKETKILKIRVLKSSPKLIALLATFPSFSSSFGRVKQILFFSFLATMIYWDGSVRIPFCSQSPAFLYQYSYQPRITTHLWCISPWRFPLYFFTFP